MAKDTYCPKCSRMHDILLMECPPPECVHKWAHIEDHHCICEKCKMTADLCWTCETPKKDYNGRLLCPKCNGL